MVPLKHPETPSGIPERDWMLTRRTLDHVPVKKKKSNFPSFCLVAKHQDFKLERIFLIKIYDTFKYELFDGKAPFLADLFVKSDVQEWLYALNFIIWQD